MSRYSDEQLGLDEATAAFYRHGMRLMSEAGIDFLVGGAYAFAHFTGIVRHTKDLDLFIRPRDVERSLAALRKGGYRTSTPDPIWLSKAFCHDAFIDFIYRGRNGVGAVDDEWFEHASTGTILGYEMKLCPPEETISSKAYVAERDRYDGSDVAHYILAYGARMDWQRLIRRFGPNWRLLLSHLILFGLIYPTHRDLIPAEVIHDLLDRAKAEGSTPDQGPKVCHGTLFSAIHYLVDVGPWGYQDGRFLAAKSIAKKDLERWRSASKTLAPAMLKAAGISLAETAKQSPLH